jgi:hypothetical protein
MKENFKIKAKKLNQLPGLIPVITTISKAEIRKILVQDQPGQKVPGGPITTNSWAWWSMPFIPATWEAEIGWRAIPGQPKQKVCELFRKEKVGHGSVCLLSQLWWEA